MQFGGVRSHHRVITKLLAADGDPTVPLLAAGLSKQNIGENLIGVNSRIDRSL